ncbi:RSB1 Sphingoid long-chain base transporter RSB1 [Candida maltosa Xu316]
MSIIETIIKRAEENETNYFGHEIDMVPNVIYLALYAIIFGYLCLMMIKSRYWWFNISFFIGYGLEMLGFLGRTVAANGKETELALYAVQSFCTTVAPAFIMGGVYFLFGQLIFIHGKQYSLFRPMWYSYFFITTDVICILMQGSGGGISSSSGTLQKVGNVLMIAGVGAQVGFMTLFLILWTDFLFRAYFKYSSQEEQRSLLFNASSDVRSYKANHLDEHYDPDFYHIRHHSPLFGYFPLAMTVAVILIYIRCIYRVVEMSQGWNGYLMVHEVYLMVLDALMIVLAGIIFMAFHPYWIFGKENVLKAKDLKAKKGMAVNALEYKGLTERTSL